MFSHVAMIVAVLEAAHPTASARIINPANPVILAAAKASATQDANLPYVDSLVARAEQLLKDGPERDPAAAASFLEEAASAGNVQAMIMLSDLARRGDGVPASFTDAKSFLESAVAAGARKDGARLLGDLYRLADAPNRDAAKAAQFYQQAADLGDPWAMFALADLVSRGDGVTADFDRARTLLEGAVAGGAAKDGWRQIGELYRLADPKRRNLAEAAEAYQKAADLGDIGAMLTLAEMVRTGNGAPADFIRSRKLLENAIAAGAVKDGARLLGDLYRFADKPNRDPARAAKSYRRAIELGDTFAMLALARMTASGDGVPADFNKAVGLVDDAIAAGTGKDGWLTLGDLYRAAGEHTDLAKAADAYQKAADLGHGGAMIALAGMVEKGEGVPADFGRAEALLHDAVATGLVMDGSRALGDLYRAPGDAGRDPVKALAAYKQAADLGDAAAMISLAQMLGHGEGTAVDFDAAKALLESAEAGGMPKEAWRELGELYRMADASHRDPAKAADAYQRAVELGDVSSMMRLAQIVGSGDGIPVDFDRAKALLESAVKAGAEMDGWRALGDLHRSADAAHRDLTLAADYYQRAVGVGDGWSMMALAPMVAKGDGVPADFGQAVKLTEGAIAAGLAEEGWRALGELYRAPGANQDYAKAAVAFQHAVDRGDAGSMLALGHMLGRGEGASVDFGKAETLLKGAIAGGLSKDGSFELGELYRNADDDNRNLTKATAAYQDAVDVGNPAAMIALASLVGRSEDLPADFKRAKTLLDGAIAAGLQKDGLNELGDLYRLTDPQYRDPMKAIEAYQGAVDLGHTGAMMSLARMLATGDGAPVDFDRARALLESAIAAGVTKDGWRSLADLYRNADAAHRDLGKAAQGYQTAVDLGDAWSMMALAEMTVKGDGVPADFVKARTLIEGAIAGGLTKDGSRALGDLYRNADAETRDPAKAAEAYVTAVGLGDTGSMLALANILANGDGIAVDFNKARGLIESAIAAGEEKDGQRALGDLYRTAGAVYRDPVKAARAYERAIELGDAWAMLPLAQMIAKGDGVRQDFDKARTLLQSAIDRDVGKDAYHALGDLYRFAGDGNSDPAAAIAAYEKAADLGDAWAILSLAEMVNLGEGTKADTTKALSLAQKAIDAGLVKDGSRLLGAIYVSNPARRDPAKAAVAFQKAIDLGDPYATMAFAPMLALGDGVPANFNKARDMLEATIAAGYAKDAAKILGDLYLSQPRTNKTLAKARESYALAAQAGNAQANLRLAIILSNQFKDPSARAGAIEQFRIASSALGPDFVAKEMMRLNAKTLIAMTQGFLAEYGYEGPVDGVTGPGMQASIKIYCDARRVEKCETSFVRQSLLAQLLSDTQAPKTMEQ
ncbi:MAG: hypothetical protein ABI399_02690 [Bauldia sp.]